MYLFVAPVPDTKTFPVELHMDSVLSASFCHSSGPCSGAKLLCASQWLARNGTTEMAARAEREELDGWKKERSQVKQTLIKAQFYYSNTQL